MKKIVVFPVFFFFRAFVQKKCDLDALVAPWLFAMSQPGSARMFPGRDARCRRRSSGGSCSESFLPMPGRSCAGRWCLRQGRMLPHRGMPVTILCCVRLPCAKKGRCLMTAARRGMCCGQSARSTQKAERQGRLRWRASDRRCRAAGAVVLLARGGFYCPWPAVSEGGGIQSGAMSSKAVYGEMYMSSATPTGPLRCLPMMISATPLVGRSAGLL